MSLDLPDLLTRYFAAENGNDMESLAACFADHGVVRDEGRNIMACRHRQWMSDAKQKYQHTVEPISIAERDGKTIVTARVAGNFPNSPVNLDHIFAIEGDRIASLEIH